MLTQEELQYYSNSPINNSQNLIWAKPHPPIDLDFWGLRDLQLQRMSLHKQETCRELLYHCNSQKQLIHTKFAC